MHARYAPLLKKIAALYSADAALHAHLESIRVLGEEWDSNRAGGHFYFQSSTPGAPLPCDEVVVQADDGDGGLIEVILHFIGPHGDWGEWFRYDMEPVIRWPPSSIRMP